MEDDDEIQSHRSARSGSQNSQRSDRRISVTVASATRHQNTLTVALPMPQPRTVAGGGGGGRGGGGGGREDCWSEGATAVLIDAWGERYVELNRGNLKQKHWKEVADVVNSRDDCCSKAPKTDVQCKNRIDTVKKKYKLEKTKITSAGGRSSWIFYDRLDQLIGNTVKNSSSSLATPPLRSVPVGIPVGVRSAPVQSLRLKQQQQQQHQQLQQQRKRIRSPPAYSDSSESEPKPSRDSPESDSADRKRPRALFNAGSALRPQKQGSRENHRGDSVRELTKAIMKFAEAYEQMESSKMQKMVELQKQSMKFAKELELQRIQFFMKTQLELSQLKHSRRNGENDNKIHHSNNRNTINNNNRSDDRNN